jgi:phage terminase large subunit
MKLRFDPHGNLRQYQCALAWKSEDITEIIYGGSKGSAKSYTGCSLIFGDSLMYPNTQYFIARKELNDLRKFTIPSILEVFSHWKITPNYYNYNGQDNYFEMHNRSKVFLLAAKTIPSDPEFQRFGSMQMTRGWMEEGGEFSENAKINLAASIGRWKNNIYNLIPKLLITCNPSKNFLYKDYKENKEGKLPNHKKFIQALPQDNKMLPDGYIEHLYKTLKGADRQRLLFGNWEYDNDPSALIPYDNIMNCFTNKFVAGGKKYITADIARFGKDNTVIIIWNGWRAEKIITLKKKSVVQVAEEIRSLAFKNQIPLSNIIVDEDGVGGGVKDILECKGFVNNSTPLKKENYTNLKSQCSFHFSDSVNNNLVYICCDELKETIKEEMEQIKQDDIDKDGKKRIVPKEKVKEFLGRSPDYSDALIMRKYFDIQYENIIY